MKLDHHCNSYDPGGIVINDNSKWNYAYDGLFVINFVFYFYHDSHDSSSEYYFSVSSFVILRLLLMIIRLLLLLRRLLLLIFIILCIIRFLALITRRLFRLCSCVFLLK